MFASMLLACKILNSGTGSRSNVDGFGLDDFLNDVRTKIFVGWIRRDSGCAIFTGSCREVFFPVARVLQMSEEADFQANGDCNQEDQNYEGFEENADFTGDDSQQPLGDGEVVEGNDAVEGEEGGEECDGDGGDDGGGGDGGDDDMQTEDRSKKDDDER